MQGSREKPTGPVQQGGHDGSVEEWKPKKRDYLVLFSLALVSLVVALDSTILITSLPAISHDLGGTSTEAFWAATSYLLTYAVLQPVIASLSDIFGRRTSLFMSVLLFTIGSLIAAVAQNFACLLAGRTIQGIGGGGVMVLVLVIATDVVPLRYLPKYQGLVQIAWALGTMTGPLIGGIFAQLTTWRWVFYINFPICGIGLVLVPFVIPSGARTGSAKGRVVTIDFVGAALLVASFTTFLVAITLGGTTFPWGSVHIILPLVLGILGIAATFAWEIFAAQTPILRPSLFKRRFSTVPYLCAFLQGFLLMATFYYYALHLTPTKHLTPILTGTALLSATASLIPLSVLSGILISKTGHLRIFIVSGWALTILGTGLLSLSTQHTATPAWVWFLIVTGAGHGVLVVGHVYAAQANVQPQDAGNATAFCCFVRSVGFCAGVAVGGAVLQNVLEGKVAGRGLETGVGAGTDVISFAGMLRALPRGEQRTETLMDVFSESFRVLALVLTGIGGVGGGLSVFVPRFVAGYTSSRVQAEGV